MMLLSDYRQKTPKTNLAQPTMPIYQGQEQYPSGPVMKSGQPIQTTSRQATRIRPRTSQPAPQQPTTTQVGGSTSQYAAQALVPPAYSAMPQTGGYSSPASLPNWWTEYQQTGRVPGLNEAPNKRQHLVQFLDDLRSEKLLQLLGPELFSIIGGPGGMIQRQDIPFIDFRLAYETQQMSEADRAAAINELVRAWGNVGADPASSLARESAMGAVQGGGPFGEEYRDVQRGMLQNQAARALGAGQEDLAAEYARRGLGGAPSSYEQAVLGQQAAGNLQQQIAGMEQFAAQANEAARQASLAQLMQLAQQEAAQRQALSQAISQIYATTEREPLSTAGLLESLTMPHRRRNVWEE